ncbi:hypothetical protein RLON56S_01118 [Alishewanella longhuensis]
MDRMKLKSLASYLPTPFWLEQTPSSRKKRVLLIGKESYVEHRKVYKVGLADALKLIRNELKVLRSKGSIAVWKKNALADGKTEVLYAVFEKTVTERLGHGLYLLLPETWALAYQLQSNKLYRVEGPEPYWAMYEIERLHIAPIKGLMQQKQFFLDAIGLQGETLTAETFSPRDTIFTLPQLPWQHLLGLLVWNGSTNTARAMIPWKKLGVTAGVVFTVYALCLSAALVVTENYLQSQVQQLQVKANALFTEQEQQARKRDALLAYQQEFEKLPPISKIAAHLTAILLNKADINRLEITGAQIQIRGTADSATEILALLAEQPHWNEVRFIEDTRKMQSKEQFALSMVLKAGAFNE